MTATVPLDDSTAHATLRMRSRAASVVKADRGGRRAKQAHSMNIDQPRDLAKSVMVEKTLFPTTASKRRGCIRVSNRLPTYPCGDPARQRATSRRRTLSRCSKRRIARG
jgi:hypothetical protein